MRRKTTISEGMALAAVLGGMASNVGGRTP
jgi:hypothetical protein